MPTNDPSTTLQFISILVTVAGLLGWIVQTIIKYFIKSSDAKSLYIEKLVALNQQNTEKFIETVNHQRTMDREMHGNHIKAIENLTKELNVSNTINRELVTFLKQPRSV